MAYNNLTQFPSQKKSTAQKLANDKKWAKECIDASEGITDFNDNRIRRSYYNKKVNYDLYNDILDQNDIQQVTNPMGLRDTSFPAKMQNYPIANPKIDLLIGEEFKRRFDWRVRSVNSDAISQKESEKKDQLMLLMKEHLTQDAFNEEEAKKELQKLNKYLNYDYQDIRELNATRLLTYLYKDQELKTKFNAGFLDGLISAEEIYCCDIISGEPIMRKVNPLNLYTLRSGDSHFIEDSDIIIEFSYESIGRVIDMFYDELTPKEVDDLESGHSLKSETNSPLNHRSANAIFDLSTLAQERNGQDGLVEVNSNADQSYTGGTYDTEGNVKVTRVVWKSRRKLGKLKYYDEEGNEQEKIVDENYKAEKEKGEEIKWIWVNEWWEGTKIGESIYVKIGPRPVQYRSMDNISKCYPGYVGTLYATNDSKAKSLMDRMKPYQYLYNVFMYRTELAFAKSKGKIAQLDLSLVPDGWELDKWMYYAEVLGWAPVDRFKEGTKGAAQGKLSGQFQQPTQILDMEMGSYIQQHVMMLQYLETQMGEIAGVSKQRQGQVSSNELVGNVERAVSQSSHITEKWFSVHDNTKLRALATLLETAKYAYKKGSKKLQYVTDELQTVMFEIDGEMFNEADYGLFISNTNSDMELLSSLKSLAHAGIQNDKISFSQLMDIYNSDSISSIRRKIEKSEADKIQEAKEDKKQEQENQQQMAAKQQEAQKELQQMQIDNREDEQAHEMEKALLDSNTKLQIKAMDFDKRKGADDDDTNDNSVRDDIDLQKLVQSGKKIEQDFQLKKEQLMETKRKNLADEKIKNKDLKQKKEIASKPAMTK